MNILIVHDVSPTEAYHIMEKILQFDYDLTDTFTAYSEELEQRVVYRNEKIIDERGDLYDILMLLANQMFPNLSNRHIYCDLDTYLSERS